MGNVVEKLRYFPKKERERINSYLDELTRDNKINEINLSMITTGGIWKICVDFKEVEDASEFLMKFWRLKYNEK